MYVKEKRIFVDQDWGNERGGQTGEDWYQEYFGPESVKIG